MVTLESFHARRASLAWLMAGSLFPFSGCAGEDGPPQAAAAVEPATAPGSPASTHTDIAVSESIRARCNVPENPREAPQFDFDAASLRPRGEGILDKVAECMRKGSLQGQRLRLVGHADPRGPDSYNRQLGMARALAARDHLRSRGVPASALDAASRGELDATGTDPASWQLDRRVDIEAVPEP